MRVKVDGTNYQAAAGTTVLTSEALDTQGFESVEFDLCVGAITAGAVTSIEIHQCDTSGGTYAALLGSKVTIADTDDNKVVCREISQPRERYLKIVTNRATQNAVVESCVVRFHGAKEMPVSDDATVVGGEIHSSPAEGTA